jgi:23S rRNA (uracil1939-C5)-methyltransferase
LNLLDVHFEKIVPEGKALGFADGKAVFAFGVLPGETAKVVSIKSKKDYTEAEPVEIYSRSEYRREPREDHFISCSPWQIIDYEHQLTLKEQIIRETFSFLPDTLDLIEKPKHSGVEWGYRTKVEYSFADNNRYPEQSEGKQDGISLAFHKRGKFYERVLLPGGCCLTSDRTNRAALSILDTLSKQGLESKPLKSLIIRESKTGDDLVAILCLKDPAVLQELKISDFPDITGLITVHSDYRSPASVFTEILSVQGREHLEEQILNLTVRYPFDGFFQNNIPQFERVLLDIRAFVEQIKPSKTVELYSGVGIIGLAVAHLCESVIGVEVIQSATEYAKLNAQQNKIDNYTAIFSPSEKIDPEVLSDTDLLILDPPRTGLHKNVIKMILEQKPKNIIYLSCNPVTQARDFALFQDFYKPDHLSVYDFYPNTPHLESLMVLSAKQIY